MDNFCRRHNGKSCADPESCVRGSPTQLCQRVFIVDEERERVLILLKASHHRSAIEISMAFRLRADDGPKLNADLEAL